MAFVGDKDPRPPAREALPVRALGAAFLCGCALVALAVLALPDEAAAVAVLGIALTMTAVMAEVLSRSLDR